jgi:hypothetical protein
MSNSSALDDAPGHRKSAGGIHAAHSCVFPAAFVIPDNPAMTSRLPVTQPEHSLSWYAELHLGFAESLADHYHLMERGEVIMRDRGEIMLQDGVR